MKRTAGAGFLVITLALDPDTAVMRAHNPLHNGQPQAGTAALKGNQDMVTDAGVGVLMARSAALGALMNAKINLSSLKDRKLVNNLETKIAHLKHTVIQKEAEILGALKV